MNAQNVNLSLTKKEYIWNLSDLEHVEKNGYKVFSCFSGGGGSTMGYKLAGFEMLGNCEIDDKMNKIYLHNHKPKFNYKMGVQEFNNMEDLPKELFNLDILDGSPPCSSFSIAGARDKHWGETKKFREGQAEQELDNLFFDFINTADKLKPKIIVAENVKGLIMGKAKGYVAEILKEFDKIGYDTQMFLLDASKMGVPQKRQRVFFIARRKDLKLNKLELKFNEKSIKYKEFKDDNFIKMNRDTLEYKRWLKRIKSDNKLSDTVKRHENGKVSRFNSVFLKDNKTPNTLTAGSPFLRMDKPGFASDKDLITIQTFPQDYDFLGQSVNYVCGMSVPPVMMAKLSKEIKTQMLDKM